MKEITRRESRSASKRSTPDLCTNRRTHRTSWTVVRSLVASDDVGDGGSEVVEAVEKADDDHVFRSVKEE